MADGMSDGTIKIDKGIPMPDAARGGKKKYPLDKLEIGDSFFVSCLPTERARVQTACWHYGRYHKRKFCTRRQEGGIRVWRFA